MASLVVEYQVPLSDEIICKRWIPEGDSDAIDVDEDGVRVSVRASRAGITHSPGIDAPLTSNNLELARLDVVSEVECGEELLAYCQSDPRDMDGDLCNAQVALGWRLLEAVVRVVNRLLWHINVQFGQHWVSEVVHLDRLKDRPLADWCAYLKARTRTAGGGWIVWYPRDRGARMIRNEHCHALTQERWNIVREQVRRRSKPPLALELLGNARWFFAQGRFRPACIEAACAIELAIVGFARSPSPEALVRPGETLLSDVEHLGFSRFLKYLLPVVLAEGLLEARLLESASALVELRNNVIHNGQRTIQRQRLELLLADVQKVVLALMDKTIGVELVGGRAAMGDIQPARMDVHRYVGR